MPSSLYRLQELKQFSLDWFSYLNAEFLSVQTKILKTDTGMDGQGEEDGPERHRDVLSTFMNLCKMHHIFEFKKVVEAQQAE